MTGKAADINAIRQKLGDRGAKFSEHRNEVLLANVASGDWERKSVFGDINTLAMSVRAMHPVWRAELGRDEASQRLTTRAATRATRASPGQALFARTCAPATRSDAATGSAPISAG